MPAVPWLPKFILQLLLSILDGSIDSLPVHEVWSKDSGPTWLAVPKYLPFHCSSGTLLLTFHIHLLFQFTTQFYSSRSSSPLYTHIAFNYFLPVPAGSCSASNHLLYSWIASKLFWVYFDFYLLPIHWCLILMSLPRHHLLDVYITFINLMCYGILCIFLERTYTIFFLS